jgi:hypothetical protein
MRGETPTLHCDAEDGACGNWDADHYAMHASTIDGIPLTRTHRALGWFSTDDDHDLCPEHAPTEETR